MKRRNLFIGWCLLLTLLLWTGSPPWAVPLSLDQNIKAILADRAGSDAGFDFVVVGDNRGGEEVYHRILTRAKAFHPLFILNTGDMVSGWQPSEYEDYKKQIASCEIPILHLPGNHDVLFGSEAYRENVGPFNWYFDLGNFRIIGLDNASGKFSAGTVAFARETLTSRKICLVAFHKPPPVGRWAAHAMAGDQEGGHWGEMRDLIKKAKVPMVFLGHIHLYDEMEIDGTKYIISGGGGAPLYSQYHFGKPEYGFILVKIRPEGITHQWIPLGIPLGMPSK
jgi:3',5'-cyclic-AMP phosphodiesterase